MGTNLTQGSINEECRNFAGKNSVSKLKECGVLCSSLNHRLRRYYCMLTIRTVADPVHQLLDAITMAGAAHDVDSAVPLRSCHIHKDTLHSRTLVGDLR